MIQMTQCIFITNLTFTQSQRGKREETKKLQHGRWNDTIFGVHIAREIKWKKKLECYEGK